MKKKSLTKDERELDFCKTICNIVCENEKLASEEIFGKVALEELNKEDGLNKKEIKDIVRIIANEDKKTDLFAEIKDYGNSSSDLVDKMKRLIDVCRRREKLFKHKTL